MNVMKLKAGELVAKRQEKVMEWYLIQEGSVVQKFGFSEITLISYHTKSFLSMNHGFKKKQRIPLKRDILCLDAACNFNNLQELS